jgi:hypothetical protein
MALQQSLLLLISALVFCVVSLSTPCSGFVISYSCFRQNTFRRPENRLCRQFKSKTSTQLYLQNNATQGETTEFWKDRIEDSGLLVGDLFAIAIASQLIGLLDIVNDPEFVRSGGWFQPIPSIPSTLDVLVQRISTLSLTWILVALARKDSFSFDSITSDEVAIKKSLRIVLDFSFLRLFVAVGIAYGTHADLDVGGVLRECYFVALTVPGFRFLYGQYFR